MPFKKISGSILFHIVTNAIFGINAFLPSKTGAGLYNKKVPRLVPDDTLHSSNTSISVTDTESSPPPWRLNSHHYGSKKYQTREAIRTHRDNLQHCFEASRVSIQVNVELLREYKQHNLTLFKKWYFSILFINFY